MQLLDIYCYRPKIRMQALVLILKSARTKYRIFFPPLCARK